MATTTVTNEKLDTYPFGKVVSVPRISGAATASAVSAFSIFTKDYTGKKVLTLAQTSTVAGTITYVVYGSYDASLTKAQFEAYMDAADLENVFVVTGGSSTVVAAAQAQIETTNPYQWIGVTLVGNTFTYNITFAGC